MQLDRSQRTILLDARQPVAQIISTRAVLPWNTESAAALSPNYIPNIPFLRRNTFVVAHTLSESQSQQHLWKRIFRLLAKKVSCPTVYRFPITDRQYRRGQVLLAGLQDDDAVRVVAATALSAPSIDSFHAVPSLRIVTPCAPKRAAVRNDVNELAGNPEAVQDTTPSTQAQNSLTSFGDASCSAPAHDGFNAGTISFASSGVRGYCNDDHSGRKYITVAVQPLARRCGNDVQQLVRVIKMMQQRDSCVKVLRNDLGRELVQRGLPPYRDIIDYALERNEVRIGGRYESAWIALASDNVCLERRRSYRR